MTTTIRQRPARIRGLPDRLQVDIWHLGHFSVEPAGPNSWTWHTEYLRFPFVVEGPRPKQGSRDFETVCPSCGLPLKFRMRSRRSLRVRTLASLSLFVVLSALGSFIWMSWASFDDNWSAPDTFGLIVVFLAVAAFAWMITELGRRFDNKGVDLIAKRVPTGATGKGSEQVRAHKWSMRGSDRPLGTD